MTTTLACVIGISGYSGSGKSTLIEKALPLLKGEGLRVGILKHTTHHSLELDVKGKDTDRFYKAGADFVFAHDAAQGFARYPLPDAVLPDVLGRFPRGLDLIIVEGHKDAEMPRVWLETGKPGSEKMPEGIKARTVLYRNDPWYLEKFLEFVHDELQLSHSLLRLNAGLLVGGKSSRMGRSKALLEINGETLAERSHKTLSRIADRTLLLGSTILPGPLRGVDRLPDISGIKGPLAGMLSAFRWDPACAWIISSVDMPLMHKRAWEWLLSQRRPGVWAVLPCLKPAGAETTGACYEPMIFGYIESLAEKGISKLQVIAKHPKVSTPLVPPSLASAWKNVNTAEEWEAALNNRP